jgi:hypothetical protein
VFGGMVALFGSISALPLPPDVYHDKKQKTNNRREKSVFIL